MNESRMRKKRTFYDIRSEDTASMHFLILVIPFALRYIQPSIQLYTMCEQSKPGPD